MTNRVSSVFMRVACVPVALLFVTPQPHTTGHLSRMGQELDARATLESHFEEWRSLMQRKDQLGDQEFHTAFAALLERLFALDSVASRVLKDRWATLTAHERSTFLSALTAALENKIVAHLGKDGHQPLPWLKFQNGNETGDVVTLVYAIEGHGRQEPVSIAMRKRSGRWRIADIEFAGANMVTYYQTYCARLLSDYSFPYLVAELGEYPYVILEDFEATPAGELPLSWSWKGKDDKKRKPYRVREEDGNKYLEATDEGESVIIGKDIKWDLRKYPYVSFRWRGHKLPVGADERLDDKIDSAAGLYFLYREILGLIPESVKYVWSSTLPVGSAMRRSGTGKPWMIVAESGEDRLGEWHTYVFNLYEAYQKTFGGSPPTRPIGIGILSDGNTVKSQAYADYDDIRALRTADPGVDSGVRKILEAN